MVNGAALDREPNEVTIPCRDEAELFELTSGIDGRICELTRGEVIVHSPVKKAHAELAALLVTILKVFLDRRGTGSIHTEPYSMRLAPDLIRQPDLFFVTTERSERLTDDYLDGAADLVIEIVSDTPASRRRDTHEKREEYESHGVREYWAIDSARSVIHAHVLDEAGRYTSTEVRSGRLDSVACVGFWLDVDWLLGERLADSITCLTALLGPRLGAEPA